MSHVPITVPQMGEGLQEVLIRDLHRQAGEPISRDEGLYSVETDKAAVCIESPVSGTVLRWLVEPGQVVRVGTTVAVIEAEQGAEALAPATPSAAPRPAQAAPRQNGKALIPPRTRAHARAHGLDDDALAHIPASGGRLSPEDVDRYVFQLREGPFKGGAAPATGPADGQGFRARPLAPAQRVLNYRFRRSAQAVVPTTIRRPLDSVALQRVTARFQQQHRDRPIGELDVIAWRLAQVAARHPNFRSTLADDHTVREYDHVHLGLGVDRGDELVTALLENADTFTDLPTFADALQARVRQALERGDQATERMQVVITYVGSYGVVDATPVLLAPAVAVLAVGSPMVIAGHAVALLSLTFDHRLINGVEAARVLDELARSLDDAARPEPVAAPRGELAERLRAGPVAEREAALVERLRAVLAELLAVAPAAVALDAPLRSQGLSSLASVRLAERLAGELACDIAPTLVWYYPTVRAIARHLAGLVEADRGASPPAPAPAAAEADRVLAAIEQLSEQEAAEYLRRLT